MEEDLDKIARLVKAKEDYFEKMGYNKKLATDSEMDWEKYYRQEKKKYALKAYRCMRCEISISDDQYNNYGICKECYKSHPNPTDSVTSDGTMITPTKSPRGQCNCAPEEQHGETSVMCCNRCGKPTEDFWSKPTESQDELWKDLIDVYDLEDRKGYGYATLIKALSARFKIERI